MEVDGLEVAQTAVPNLDGPLETERRAAAPVEAVVVTPDAPALTLMGVLSKASLWDYGVFVLLAVIFAPMFASLYHFVWSKSDEPQSYGLLIIPASLALAWMLRGRLVGLKTYTTPLGLLPVALGLLLLAFGTLIDYNTFSSFGFVLATAGAVWAMWGTSVARALWFPLAYLLAMVKVPSVLINEATFRLQTISIKGASLLLRPLYDVKIDGTQMHLGGYSLNVIAPCSGMTILLPIVVLAVYYLYLIKAPLWKKGALFALTIPVSLVVNALRVALIGVVGEAYGGKAAETFHDWSGIITVLLGFGALIFMAQGMKCSQLHEDISL